MMVVVGLAVITCIGEEQNLCWFCFLIHILRKESWYVIAGPLLILPTHLTIVATTHWNGTHSLLTSAKLSVGYLVVGITRELNKKPSLHCSSIYINYMWSILQQYLLVLMSMHHPHVLLLIYHKATMSYTCVLTSYSLISAVHVCNMYIL